MNPPTATDKQAEMKPPTCETCVFLQKMRYEDDRCNRYPQHFSTFEDNWCGEHPDFPGYLQAARAKAEAKPATEATPKPSPYFCMACGHDVGSDHSCKNCDGRSNIGRLLSTAKHVVDELRKQLAESERQRKEDKELLCEQVRSRSSELTELRERLKEAERDRGRLRCCLDQLYPC